MLLLSFSPPPLCQSHNHGDFNADPGHLGGPLATTSINSQGRILHRFNLTSAHLHKSDLLFSHTFESDAHSTVSTIDHILCPRHSLPAILSAHPIDNLPLNTSDHLPVFARLAAHLPLPTSSPTSSCPIQNHLHIPRNWSGTPKGRNHHQVHCPLQTSPITNSPKHPSDYIHESHPDTIDRLLSDLTTCLLTTSRNIPPNKFHPAKRPGWDPALKSASRSCKHHYRA